MNLISDKPMREIRLTIPGGFIKPEQLNLLRDLFFLATTAIISGCGDEAKRALYFAITEQDTASWFPYDLISLDDTNKE